MLIGIYPKNSTKKLWEYQGYIVGNNKLNIDGLGI